MHPTSSNIGAGRPRVLGGSQFSLKTDCFVLLLVKHPSGDGDAVYRKKIAVEVLVFIENYRAQVRGVVIFITLLAGLFLAFR